MIRIENEMPAIKLGDIAASARETSLPFMGATIVVTGKLKHFTRAAIHAEIESLGAKVRRTVTKNTDYLICGENAGGKLNKAHLLGVQVLSEQEFLAMAQRSDRC